MSAQPLEVARGRLFATTAEVAAILEADPRTVRHGIEAGVIPSVRVSSGTIRVPWVPFLRDVCGLDDAALQALDLPGYSPAPPSASGLRKLNVVARQTGAAS